MIKRVFLLLIMTFLVLSLVFSDQSKGVKIEIEPFYPGCKIGKQYVVLIAINEYQNWQPLQNPVNDAAKIKKILISKYHIDKVDELYNENATKMAIMKLFEDMQIKIQPDDSFLIFYSGHGYLDKASNNGFWIPVDGGEDRYNKDRWISNSEILGNICKMKSKHILIISDSCFSGDLLQGYKEGAPEINSEYFKKAYSLFCRQALTSGARERVPDDSEFSNQLIIVLEENMHLYLDTLMIYSKIRLGIKKTFPLCGELNCGELKEANHQQGASFLFFLKSELDNGGSGGEIDIKDLEDLAKLRNKIQTEIDKIKKFEVNPEASSELIITAWNRLLEYYMEKNVWKYAEQQENFVKRMIDYWKKIDYRNRKNADDDAFQSARKGNLIDSYEKYISEYPEGQHVAKAYYNCGDIYYKKEEYDKAVSSFSKAIGRDSKYVWAYIYRGISYDKQKNYENAISDYSKAIELDPKETIAYKNLGLTYDHMGEYAKAIYNYTKMIDINPKDEVAFYYRGASYDDSGKYELAIKDFTKAIKLNPNDVFNYHYRGISYEHSGEYEKAISDYRDAIKINPDYIEAYENLSDVYKKLGKRKEAEEFRAKAEKLKNKKNGIDNQTQ